MPELPEIETITRYLKPRIFKRRILSLDMRGKRVLRHHPNLPALNRRVLGQRITEVNRSGKYAVLVLANGERLLFHLMMTGQLLLNPKDTSPHDRLVLGLSGGARLVFRDIRQFGFCRLAASSEEVSGYDPLKITFKKFKDVTSAQRKRIKEFFLDQKFISGIGNIYADEILWHAGIGPLRSAGELTDEEIKNLYRAMRRVLQLAIYKEGASMRNYLKPDGSGGGYYEIRKAYKRAGKSCPRDGGIIQRMVIGGRSAHFCPVHQV